MWGVLILEWNVIIYNINSQQIEIYNIFKHYKFSKEVKELISKENNKQHFESELKKILMYYFWCKAEWEIIVSDFPSAQNVKEKFDVFSQIYNNFQHFANYIWEYYKKDYNNET